MRNLCSSCGCGELRNSKTDLFHENSARIEWRRFIRNISNGRFSSILCWVLQHVQIPENQQKNLEDLDAAKLKVLLSEQSICKKPWEIPIFKRDVPVPIPAARNFVNLNAFDFLKKLRNAVAHGDARNIEPFHSEGRGADRLLLGFTFRCAEGEITLLESDMRRIATTLAEVYCNALSRGSQSFTEDAHRHVKERAA